MAFACVKMQWEKMKATEVATAGPPEGKNHQKPERYFEDVLEGAQIVEGQCSKDVMFDYMYSGDRNHAMNLRYDCAFFVNFILPCSRLLFILLKVASRRLLPPCK